MPVVASDSGLQIPDVVHTLAERKRIPVISWTVSAAQARRPAYWKTLAQQINQVHGAILLRPQLNIADAVKYRHYWRTMHQLFQQEKVVNVIWVWTPEANDIQLDKFPGIVYVNWLASDLHGSALTPDYLALRHRLTYDLALHQMPVLLQAPAPSGNTGQAVRKIAANYPEISAVIFAAPVPASEVRQTTAAL